MPLPSSLQFAISFQSKCDSNQYSVVCLPVVSLLHSPFLPFLSLSAFSLFSLFHACHSFSPFLPSSFPVLSTFTFISRRFLFLQLPPAATCLSAYSCIFLSLSLYYYYAPYVSPLPLPRPLALPSSVAEFTIHEISYAKVNYPIFGRSWDRSKQLDDRLIYIFTMR